MAITITASPCMVRGERSRIAVMKARRRIISVRPLPEATCIHGICDPEKPWKRHRIMVPRGLWKGFLCPPETGIHGAVVEGVYDEIIVEQLRHFYDCDPQKEDAGIDACVLGNQQVECQSAEQQVEHAAQPAMQIEMVSSQQKQPV